MTAKPLEETSISTATDNGSASDELDSLLRQVGREDVQSSAVADADVDGVRARLNLTPERESRIEDLGAVAITAAPPKYARPSDGMPSVAELLGRQPELRTLRNAFHATAHGKSVVLFVSGEPGMGKTALCTAFAGELLDRGRANVLASRCYERELSPFQAVASWVDDLGQELRGMSVEELTAVLPRDVRLLAKLFPKLAEIPAIGSAAPADDDAETPAEPADPEQLERRAFDAFAELLVRLRDRAPLVLWLDDAQWLDRDSLRFWRALLLRPEPLPLLLVCAHRGESDVLSLARKVAEDCAQLDVRELRVGPLSHAALCLLAKRLLPGGASSHTADALASEAEGSPFIAAQLSRALSARGVDQAMPRAAEALALHCASLPEPARKLLSFAALAGQPLPAEVLIEAANVEDAEAQLEQLRAQQFVRIVVSESGARSVECHHDQIRAHIADAADETATRDRALALARALEKRADADPAQLARLFELAGLLSEASEPNAKAADAALARLAFDRAANLYTRAFTNPSFSAERTQQMRVARARALAGAGQPEAAADAYVVAAKHAAADALPELERRAAEQYFLAGALERGRSLLERALRAAGQSLPQSAAGAAASLSWARARLRLRGLSWTAREQQSPAALRELESLGFAARCLLRVLPLRAADLNARWLLCALDAGHAVEAARALASEVYVRSVILSAAQPNVDAVEKLCESLCERTGDTRARMWLAYARGCHAARRLAEPERALLELERALTLADTEAYAGAAADRAFIQVERASCLWSLGRIAEAGELAHAAFEEALAREQRVLVAALCQTASYGFIAADRNEQAERVIEQAEAHLIAEQEHGDGPWLQARLTVGLYANRAVEVWEATASQRERYAGAWRGRSALTNAMCAALAGAAAGTGYAATDPIERRALLQEARKLAGRVSAGPDDGMQLAPRDALIACLEGDRAAAVAALRRCVPARQGPLFTQLWSRRLGELLANAEGERLIGDADAFLRRGGVVDPARFVAALAPGLDVP